MTQFIGESGEQAKDAPPSKDVSSDIKRLPMFRSASLLVAEWHSLRDNSTADQCNDRTGDHQPTDIHSMSRVSVLLGIPLLLIELSLSRLCSSVWGFIAYAALCSLFAISFSSRLKGKDLLRTWFLIAHATTCVLFVVAIYKGGCGRT